MNEIRPLFSIVIPTRDRPLLVRSLVNSLLEQEFKNFEIIVADNSSDNKSKEIINSFGDDRILYIKTGGLKMADNWNVGINAISGKYMLIFSDKGVLKRGALNYLESLIISKKYDCITWSLDAFIDTGTFLPGPSPNSSKEINSFELIRYIVGSDWESFDVAPMHCTSCISAEVIKKIKQIHGEVCQELNPDYTMAMQVLLSIESIYNLDQNLALLRRPSFEDGYGNGSSFVKKTSQSISFMKEHEDWIERTKDFADIPIHTNDFLLNIILKDVHKILKDNEKSLEEYYQKQDRLISYYNFTYLEILWRTRSGINMNQEYRLWKISLGKEEKAVRSEVLKKKSSLRSKNITSFLIYIVKINSLLSYFLKKYKKFSYKDTGLSFLSVEDCIKSNSNIIKVIKKFDI